MLMTPPAGGDTFTGNSGSSYSSAGTVTNIGPADVAIAVKRNWAEIANQQPTGLIGTSSSIWDKLRRGYEISRFNNPHVLGIMGTPPSVTQTSTLPLPNSNTVASLTPAGGFTPQFYATGGTPLNTGSGFYGFGAITTSNPPGNLGSNVSCLCFRVKLLIDAIDPVFAVGSSPNALRFIVNGQYVSLSGTVPTTTPSYIQLTFASRAKREIWIEGSSHTLLSVSVRRNESIQAVPAGLRATFPSDSIGVGTGATLNMDSFAAVLADCFGIYDVRLSGVGGQGVQAIESSGTLNLQQRLAPSINANAFIYDLPASDVIFLAMGTNDASFSFASNVAAYTACINQIQAQYPTTPIIVIGCPANNGGPNEASATCDFAIAAAVNAVNSPLVVYLQDASRGQYALETGVGNTTFPTTGALTMTAAPSAATSATLTAGFPGPTGLYTITFASAGTKPVTLTNGSTAVTWSGAITDASTALLYNGLATAVKPWLAALAVGATSATQASNWGFPTGTYLIYFSSGEVRSATFTNGSAAVSWTDPLFFAATVSCYIAAAATVPGDGDIYYASGAGPHPNTLGHANRGVAYADALYALLKGL